MDFFLNSPFTTNHKLEKYHDSLKQGRAIPSQPYFGLIWMKMWPNQIFLPIGKCISHSCWKQIHCLKLYILRPKKHLLLFEFSNNNSRIKCEICSKLTIEATDVVLVTSLLTFNIVDTFLAFFCWVWTYKCQMENFIALIWIYIVYFRVWSRSPEAKLSLTTVNNSFQLFPIFVKKSFILDVAQDIDWRL